MSKLVICTLLLVLQCSLLAQSIIIRKGVAKCPSDSSYKLPAPVNKHALKITKLIKNYGLNVYLDGQRPDMSPTLQKLTLERKSKEDLQELATIFNQKPDCPYRAVVEVCDEAVGGGSDEEEVGLFDMLEQETKPVPCIKAIYQHALYLAAKKDLTVIEALSTGFKQPNTKAKGILITTVEHLIAKVGTGGVSAIDGEAERGGGQNALCFAFTVKRQPYYFIMDNEDHEKVKGKHLEMGDKLGTTLIAMYNELSGLFNQPGLERLNEYVLELMLRDKYQGFYQQESGFTHFQFDRKSHKHFPQRHMLSPQTTENVISYFTGIFPGLANQKAKGNDKKVEPIVRKYLDPKDPNYVQVI